MRVERISGGAPYYAYAVINDHVTSDGSFVPPLVRRSLREWPGADGPRHRRDGLVLERADPHELLEIRPGAFGSRLGASPAPSAGGFTATFDPRPSAPREQRILPAYVQFLRETASPGSVPAGPDYIGSLFATVAGGMSAGSFWALARPTPEAADGTGSSTRRGRLAPRSRPRRGSTVSSRTRRSGRTSR